MVLVTKSAKPCPGATNRLVQAEPSGDRVVGDDETPAEALPLVAVTPVAPPSATGAVKAPVPFGVPSPVGPS